MYGDVSLRPERATHYVAAFEQRLGGLSRLRITLYRREDRGLLFRSRLEARVEGEQIIGETWNAPMTNSLDGYAQGVEIFVQRRSANRFTGWASYSLGYTLMRDRVSRVDFPSDQDQRHRVNVYLGYRVRPSVNISARWAYGSGFPIPGYFRKVGEQYFLAAQRNRERLPSYQTLDVRINKSRAFDRYKLTIYGEVVNALNRRNFRIDSYNGVDVHTGEAYLSFSRMFPVLPSAGVMLQF
jgi:outer membrane cobalamin receptor